MSVHREPVPDLLRRFVTTPHQAEVSVRNILLTVQTNDPQIITEMMRDSAGERNWSANEPMVARLIRDDEAPAGNSEVTVISAGPLITLLAGTGTAIALDCERRELLGFLSPAVSAELFASELLPLLLQRFRTKAPGAPGAIATL